MGGNPAPYRLGKTSGQWVIIVLTRQDGVWSGGDSNSRPLQCECSALPAELPPLVGPTAIVDAGPPAEPPGLVTRLCAAAGSRTEPTEPRAVPSAGSP
jgi:hypothetical protein